MEQPKFLKDARYASAREIETNTSIFLESIREKNRKTPTTPTI